MVTSIQQDAAKRAPSSPGRSDEWQARNDHLWQQVLEVASGDRRQLVIGERTINSPNNGQGYRNMPANPMGIAWAVKQYNGFGGGWTKGALYQMHHGAVTTTREGNADHDGMQAMDRLKLVRLAGTTNGRHYWEITRLGSRVIRAGLGDDFKRKMSDLLKGAYNLKDAKALGKWLADNFRVQSPKTPRGQKKLKQKAEALRWYLSHGDDSYRASVESTWLDDVRPQIGNLVKHFTDEGGKIVPKELKIGNRVYINEVGVSESQLAKYAKRLEDVFAKIKGWRAKALKGTLKVMLASPRNFGGTAGGKYRTSQDTLMVRATPKVLKRGSGYASFEYIIVHELGHRYEHKHSLPDNFDRLSWQTTKYSFKDGEAFAELFALGHFRLTGPWDQAPVDRFEKLMLGDKSVTRPELPPHLQNLPTEQWR